MSGSHRTRPIRTETIATSTASPSIVPNARIAVILNGNAKQVTRRYADDLKALAGPNCDVFMTTSMSHADFVVQSLVDDAYDLLITGGGDGTVLHTIDTVLNRIEERGYAHCPGFAVLRLGTGNAIAYHLGSEDPKDNLLSLDNATLQPLHLFAANGHRSTFGGFGWDARILEDYDSFKKHLGGNPITAPIMKTLAGYFAVAFGRTIPQLMLKREFQQVKVTNLGPKAYQLNPSGEVINEFGPGETLFDGETQVGCFGTIPYFGYRMKILPFATLKPGFMQLRLMNIDPIAAAGRLRSVWAGELQHPGLTDLLVSQAHLKFENKTPMHLSGDFMGGVDDLNLSTSAPVKCLRFS
jgi:hypothetical protein